MPMPSNNSRSFWRRVDTSGECWLWLGAVDADGYGRFSVNDRGVRAHRYAYEDRVGPVPDGALVLHHCDNPTCVRPDHLYAGDAAQNAQDMIRRNRGRWREQSDACLKGHPRTDENTLVSGGRRICRVCHRERQRKYAQQR